MGKWYPNESRLGSVAASGRSPYDDSDTHIGCSAISPLSLYSQPILRPCLQLRIGAVGMKGVEPLTLRLSVVCSNQLSYIPLLFNHNVDVSIRPLWSLPESNRGPLAFQANALTSLS